MERTCKECKKAFDAKDKAARLCPECYYAQFGMKPVKP